MLWIYAQLHMSQIKQIQSESICNKTKCTFLFSLSVFWCFTNLIKCIHLCLDLDWSLLSCVVYEQLSVSHSQVLYKSPTYINVPYINSTAFPTTSYPWRWIISLHTFLHRSCPCFPSMSNRHCLSMFHNFGYALVCIAVLCCAMCLPHIYTSSWAAWPLVSDQCILPVSLIDLFLALKAQQALGRNRYHTTPHMGWIYVSNCKKCFVSVFRPKTSSQAPRCASWKLTSLQAEKLKS